MFRPLLLLLLAALAPVAQATPPLQPWLFSADGEGPVEGPGLRSFPDSPALREAGLAGQLCSARGAPAPHYRLRDGHLWLVGFGRCGMPLGLDQAYAGAAQPRLADWLSGSLRAAQGRLLCRRADGSGLWQFELELELKQGRVLELRRRERDLPADTAAAAPCPAGA